MWPNVHTSRCPDSFVTNQPSPVGIAIWTFEVAPLTVKIWLLHILSSVLKLSGTGTVLSSSAISNCARSYAVVTRPPAASSPYEGYSVGVGRPFFASIRYGTATSRNTD